MTLPMMVPADIEELAVTYLTPIMAPTPVGTRLPSPAADADTISGFLRVESAGGTQPNPVEYDLNVIVHGYSPDEVHASTIARHAVAALVAATGLTINGWFVGDTSNPVTPTRLTDPNVNLPRYRAICTWRVTGHPWTPGS